MTAVLDPLRDGAWVHRRRIRGYGLLFLLASVAVAVLLVAWSEGAADPWGRALGSDFVAFWSAASLVADGAPAASVYDTANIVPRQWAVIGVARAEWWYPFLYTPVALLLFLPFGFLPYLAALASWLGLTLAAYLAVVRRGLPDGLTMLAAAAFPAVVINAGHGQNGFLTTVLFGLALTLLPSRPVLAGLATAVLAYKPHFGLLFPLAFAAGGHWRAFAAAAGGVVGLVLLTAALFGVEVWQAFLTRSIGVENLLGGLTGWYKMQAVFSTVRGWGGSVGLAWAAQALVSVPVAAVLAWIWWRPQPHPLKAAALVAGTLAATPYLFDYDYVLLALPIVWLARLGLERGFLPWERSVLALCWFMPLFARSAAQFTGIPLGPLTVLLLFALIVRRASLARSPSPSLRTASPGTP